jgi:hypothetical protein
MGFRRLIDSWYLFITNSKWPISYIYKGIHTIIYLFAYIHTPTYIDVSIDMNLRAEVWKQSRIIL